MTVRSKSKFVVIVPASLQMSPGKIASQVAHVSSLLGYEVGRTGNETWKEYLQNPVKYALQSKNYADLYASMAEAERLGCLVVPFMDSPPTTQGTEFMITAVAIFGPHAKVTKATEHLELL